MIDIGFRVQNFNDSKEEQRDDEAMDKFLSSMKKYEIFEDFYPIGYTDIMESSYHVWYYIDKNNIDNVKNIIKDSKKVVYNTDIVENLDPQGDVICIAVNYSSMYVYRTAPMISICKEFCSKFGLKSDISAILPLSTNSVKAQVTETLSRQLGISIKEEVNQHEA